MTVDAEYRLLDNLIDAYAIVPEQSVLGITLRQEIYDLYRTIIRTPQSFEDFGSLLNTAYFEQVLRVQRAAWIAQHLFGGRPCAVNQKVVLGGSGSVSPLIEQAKLRDYLVCETNPRELEAEWMEQYPFTQQFVDSALFNTDRRSISIVKAVSFSQVNRSKETILRPGPTLFEVDRSAVFENLHVDRAILSSLLFARKLLTQSIPGAKVRLYVIVLSDDAYSWNFQCTDVTDVDESDLSKKWIRLDPLPLHSSIKEYLAKGVVERLQNLPGNFNCPTLEQCLADLVPVDRATRSMMMLRQLYHSQLLASNDDQLAILSASELAGVVEGDYRIFYPRDQRRHDIEDCLWRGGFIDRPMRGCNAYSITPRGYMRLLILKPKYNKMIPPWPQEFVFGQIGDLMSTWRRYRRDAA